MEEIVLSLSHAELLKADKDYEKAANAVNLIYVRDNLPGIHRFKKGKGFTYIQDNRTLKGSFELKRIKKLAIPPAWTEVWICSLENGHIQATGWISEKGNNTVIIRYGLTSGVKPSSTDCMNLANYYPACAPSWNQTCRSGN